MIVPKLAMMSEPEPGAASSRVGDAPGTDVASLPELALQEAIESGDRCEQGEGQNAGLHRVSVSDGWMMVIWVWL